LVQTNSLLYGRTAGHQIDSPRQKNVVGSRARFLHDLGWLAQVLTEACLEAACRKPAISRSGARSYATKEKFRAGVRERDSAEPGRPIIVASGNMDGC